MDAKSKEEKILQIIEKEFAVSLSAKDAELSLIDQRILEVRKCLNLLRSGAVNNYYATTQPQQTINNDSLVAFHPAVRRQFHGKHPVNQPAIQPINQQAPAPVPDKIPRYVPPIKKESPFEVQDPRGSQYKYKQRIIIGNVSKWIAPDQRDDASSHKWMMYMRGDKELPDMSHMVEKVRFELHPSYQPHHIIEITESPYQLTRRGWGEFGVKVSLFWRNELDKMVTVVHNLKLDKTHTGLQTLGAETLVDVWLHREEEGGGGEQGGQINELFEKIESEGHVIKHTQQNK